MSDSELKISEQNLSPQSYEQLKNMAGIVAKSRLYANIDTPEKAFVLMQLCTSRKLHPIEAVNMFDIIKGRPAMNSRTLQALFQQAGGTIDYHQYDDDAVVATFTHPSGKPSLKVSFTIKEAEKAGLANKDNWRNWRVDMLKARCISRGVRAVMPEVTMGLPIIEEIVDDPNIKPIAAQVVDPVNPPKRKSVTSAKPIEHEQTIDPDPMGGDNLFSEPEPEPDKETKTKALPKAKVKGGITKAQQGFIFAKGKEAGFSANELREIIHGQYGKSTTELTQDDISKLLDYLEYTIQQKQEGAE